MSFSRRRLGLAVALAILPGCAPKWPSDRFPAGLEVKRTLFAGGGGGFRETCEAMVVEITERSATQMFGMRKSKNGVELVPAAGWKNTPIAIDEDRSFYKGAFGGCNGSGEAPLGDLPGSLERPGALYRIMNGGEGIAIIVPRARLAGFYYFG